MLLLKVLLQLQWKEHPAPPQSDEKHQPMLQSISNNSQLQCQHAQQANLYCLV
jgi:hypothetical protein